MKINGVRSEYELPCTKARGGFIIEYIRKNHGL